MESQPQNPEFRNNPENFHPWRQFGNHLMLGYSYYHCNNLVLDECPSAFSFSHFGVWDQAFGQD